MIIKYRDKPAKIAGYEALLKRLPAHHAKRGLIQEKLNGARAGLGGEERLDQLLESFDPPYPYLVLQGVELPGKCQIDLMVITPSWLVLLEVKNIAGRLRFTENPSALHQLTPAGEMKGYKSPIIQMETAEMKITKLLKQLNCPLRVQSAIVIAYPSQIVESVPAGAKVWSADEVLIQLERLQMTNSSISASQMTALGDHLLSIQDHYNPFPLAPKFDILPSEIENGVFCPRCRLKKMDRLLRIWECKSCFILSGEAHFEALEEWFMIHKSTITTTECKEFLGLPDRDAAKRLLKRMGLEERGGRRHRQYVKRMEK
ncbi:nuclease-related domain-containing protein [Planomicrobium sp. CPCC 101110]|uniref:nuclease-related domain-containing protein n=1 Tax=Planomicrobium sp. CPCC 101110 TaxID=2599619 RepID=UPI0011B7EBAA|nr:nuclease-related domain-containing protein [Planomicrobium sp. CPCC 101110]TWT27687.1 NERD domain-containing protein [Planomicrobium sp. CPCC 101110]